MPTPGEIEWARFRSADPALCALEHPDFGTLAKDEFRPGTHEVAALKQKPGKDIYLIGGARTTASLIDAGLVDELRLIVYPLIAGEGKALFCNDETSSCLKLQNVQPSTRWASGSVYSIG